ncbi:MAG TPA: exodeoxyribonuclease VII small subunit [Sulfurovum sp.]|nr:exodeoxyribonuclease VII small subunit [Sulfurovum sp.]HIM93974.1 exodeoxyribonuclease VII small subunit [Campylobacterales bacterium]
MKNSTFESKLEVSKEILNKLMDPSITLEESLKLYEEGLAEIKLAQKMIEEAKVKIEIIEKKIP